MSELRKISKDLQLRQTYLRICDQILPRGHDWKLAFVANGTTRRKYDLQVTLNGRARVIKLSKFPGELDRFRAELEIARDLLMPTT